MDEQQLVSAETDSHSHNHSISHSNSNISLVMRQTNYDSTTADQKLSEHNQNVLQVIREYMDPNKKNVTPPVNTLSKNQQIFKEIRGMMDDASRRYYTNKK